MCMCMYVYVGKGLVSGSLDKTLKYWDVSGLMNKPKKEFSSSNSSNNGDSAFAPNSSASPASAIAARKDGGGEKSSPCTMDFTGHKDYVLSVAVSYDGKWVVSGSKDRGVQFWDSRTAVVQCMLQGHKNSGEATFSVIDGLDEGGSDAFSFFLFFFFLLFSLIVISIDLSRAGQVLATGSGDWQARICKSSLAS